MEGKGEVMVLYAVFGVEGSLGIYRIGASLEGKLTRMVQTHLLGAVFPADFMRREPARASREVTLRRGGRPTGRFRVACFRSSPTRNPATRTGGTTIFRPVRRSVRIPAGRWRV